MITTLLDVILKCILIAAGVMFMVLLLAVCIAVIHIALKDRKEQTDVYPVSKHRD